MGFLTNLQGRAVHEALLGRQEAELRLLETMRRCLTTKLKHDREYASALASVATQSHKLERADELTDSLIAQAWRTMMEELENIGKVIKSNADAMEVAALDKLNTLYSDKRKCRKAYQEEHSRLVSQISQLSEEVSQKKSEYQKNLEVYKMMRARFEEHYVKSGRGGRKLDEVRDKYQKACRKLHLTHNEYVLLLRSAEEFEKDFRIILLPGLLERQQRAQESYADTWRKLLEEIAHYYNFSSEKFREIHSRVDKRLHNIHPNEEYIEFNEKTKSNSQPTVSFAFDESLIKDSSVRLPVNNLTVDNLTIDWLRNKLTELESSLRTGQERINSLLSEDPSISGTPSSRKSSTHEIQGQNVAVLAELRCEERRISAQIKTIRTALSELGCEEVPSGLDLTLDSTTDGDQIDHALQADGPQGLSPHRLVHFLRKPFKRKSAPPSPKPADRPPPHQEGGFEETNQNNKSLIDEEWFHGVLPREEVVRLLTREGDFLVRETTRNDESQTVLSVCWGGHKHFIVQTTNEGHYRFEGPAFSTIRELIVHQFNSGLPVTSRSGAILKKSISRERWELNNDDVILLDKIGRGNFGDVYKAKLKTTKQMVAVKTCRMTLPDEHKKKFLQEGRILKQYEHPNIVKLIGICVQKQPIMIVMELVPGGSLLIYLKNNTSNLILKQLLGMCRDTAAGMRYLEMKNCIHRDLAARNCLIGHDNIVKISDFGMSREEEEYIVSDGMKQIPIKWTAPEALNYGKYTSLCDVWSYGILCWEIFAKGGIPYNGLSNTKAREKIDSGYRMPAPDGTPEEMYRLMLQCWEYEPENRPHFEQIYLVVDAIFGAQR